MDGGILLHTEIVSSNEINRNLVYLTENITNLANILIHLIEHGIISNDQRQLINSEKTDSGRNDQLLALIQKKNWPERKPIFLNILRKTGNEHCADRIEKNDVNNNQSEDLVAEWWPEVKTLPKAFLERKSENCLLIDTLKNYMSVNVSEGMAVITQQVTVSGLGGIGKTTTAIWFAQQYQSDYDRILWIDCGEKSLSQSFKKLARFLKIKDSQYMDLKELATCSFQILKDFKCLLIYDNAECYIGNEGIKDVLPKCIKNFDVLITSRNKQWGDANGDGEIPQFQMDVFYQNESVEFMKKHIKVLPETADSQLQLLCDLLGNLPLAIQIAIATLNRQKQVKLETYIDKIKNTPEILHTKFDKYEHTIDKTMKISLDLIQHHESNDERKIGEIALRILSIFGFITPDNVEAIFFRAVETKRLTFLEKFKSTLFNVKYQTASFSTTDIVEAMNVLEVYSLITRNVIYENQYTHTLSIHRLLQQVIRHNFKNSEKQILTQILNCDEFLEYKLIPFSYADEKLQKKFPKIKAELIDKLELTHLLRERRFKEAVELSRIIKNTLQNLVSEYNFAVCLRHNNELTECSNAFNSLLHKINLHETAHESQTGYSKRLEIIKSTDQLNKNIVMGHLFSIYMYEKNIQRARHFVLELKRVTLPMFPLNDLINFLNLMSLPNLFLERHENENCITLRVETLKELTMKLELHLWILDENTKFHQDLHDLVLVNCKILASKNPFLKAKNVTLRNVNIGYKENEYYNLRIPLFFVTDIFDLSKVEKVMFKYMKIEFRSKMRPRKPALREDLETFKWGKNSWVIRKLFIYPLDLTQQYSKTLSEITVEHCSLDISILPPALKKLTLNQCFLINCFKSNSVEANSLPNCLEELSLINIFVKDNMDHGEQYTPFNISYFITPMLKKLKVSNFAGECISLCINLSRLTSIQSLHLADCSLVFDLKIFMSPIELTLKNVLIVDTHQMILNHVSVDQFVNFNCMKFLCLTGMTLDFSMEIRMQELILINTNRMNWERGRWIVEKVRIFPSAGPTDMKIGQLVIMEDEDDTKNSIMQTRKEELLKYFKSISGCKSISGLYDFRDAATGNKEFEICQSLVNGSPGILTTGMPEYSADAFKWQSFIDQTISNWNNGHLVYIRGEYEENPLNSISSLMKDYVWKKVLDTLAPYLQQLQTAGVVTICDLLPWININTKGVLMGYDALKDKKKFYQMTRDYLTQHHGLSSLIWVWSIHAYEDLTQLKNYWPGDKYVDVISVFSRTPLTSTEYQKVLELVGDKPCSMEAIYYVPTTQLLVAQSRWTWFTVYNNYLQLSSPFGKTEDYKNIETILNSPSVINRGSHEMFRTLN